MRTAQHSDGSGGHVRDCHPRMAARAAFPVHDSLAAILQCCRRHRRGPMANGAESITGVVLVAWQRPQRGVRGVFSLGVMLRCGGNGVTHGYLPPGSGGSATGLSAISGQAVSSSSADGHSNMGTLPPQSELFLQSFAPAERPPCAACSMSDCGTERTYLSTPGNVCLRRRSGQSRADSASCLRPERTLGADEHEVVLRPKTFAARLRPVERCARRHLG